MNWTGGGLQRHRKSNTSAAVQRQKSHFARIRASRTFPALVTSSQGAFADVVQNGPSPSQVPEVVEEQHANHHLSCSETIEDQRVALLSRPDWLGLAGSGLGSHHRSRVSQDVQPPFQLRPLDNVEPIYDDNLSEDVSIRIGRNVDQRHDPRPAPLAYSQLDAKKLDEQEHSTSAIVPQIESLEDELYAMPTPHRKTRISSPNSIIGESPRVLDRLLDNCSASIGSAPGLPSGGQDACAPHVVNDDSSGSKHHFSAQPTQTGPDTRLILDSPDLAWKAFLFSGSDVMSEVDNHSTGSTGSSMIAHCTGD